MQCKVIFKSFSFFIDKEIKSPGMKPYWMNEGKGLGYHPQCLSSQFSFKPACYIYWQLKNITLLTTSKNITLVPRLGWVRSEQRKLRKISFWQNSSTCKSWKTLRLRNRGTQEPYLDFSSHRSSRSQELLFVSLLSLKNDHSLSA